MPNDYSLNSASRKKAKSLNAADASVLIISSLSVVWPNLTPQQISQVQKVLDAAVVNPVVDKEAADLDKKAIEYRVGDLNITNQKTEHRADKVRAEHIWVSEQDRHIRLEYTKILADDALKPQTNNPDEAAYLAKIKATLEAEGVWLRITQPLIRNRNDASKYANDPREFEVWLSVGYDGDAIPANLGLIDREALLNTQRFGAEFYQEVTVGNVQRTLESQIYRLDLDIQDGIAEHNRLISRYNNAFPGIAEVSDWLGDADLPSLSIWNAPKTALSLARDNQKVDIDATQLYLVIASRGTRNAAQLLKTYAEKSSQGAAIAANISRVVAVASVVIFTTLDVSGIVRGAAIEEVESTLAARFLTKNPQAQSALDALIKETDQISYVRMPKGNIAGGVKPGTSSGIGGWPR